MAETNRYRYATAALDRVGEVENAELASFTERHKARLEPVFPDAQAPLAGPRTRPSPASSSRCRTGSPAARSSAWRAPGCRPAAAPSSTGRPNRRSRSSTRSACAAAGTCCSRTAAFHVALPVLRRLRALQPWLVPVPPGPLQASAITEANWERIATEGLDDIERSPRPAPLAALANEDGRWRVRGPGALPAHRLLGTDHFRRQLRAHLPRRRQARGGVGGIHGLHGPPLPAPRRDGAAAGGGRAPLRGVVGAGPHPREPSTTRSRSGRPSRRCARPTSTSGSCSATSRARGLSRELGIPYFVEYNGSEISMSRSFGGGGYRHEALLLRIEDAAFRQATAISVISKHVKDSLVARGIPEAKILVNPNGVDTATYAPAPPERKRAIREGLGLRGRATASSASSAPSAAGTASTCSRPRCPIVCARVPNAKFLLIGDGSKKPIVDAAIAQHRLWDRVVCTGNVPAAGGRAAPQGLRPLRLPARFAHGRQPLLRLAHQALRVHGPCAAASSRATSSRSARC